MGKIAVVSGGGRGIGRAIALELASRGTDVVLTFLRDRGSAERTAADVRARGVRAIALRSHAGDREHVRRLFAETQAQLGGVDIFVANAAQGVFRPAAALDAKALAWTFETNVHGLLWGAEEAASRMAARGGGAIVAISSIGAGHAMPSYAAIGASKAAVESLVRYLAVELAPSGVAVNAVSGAVLQTAAFRRHPDHDALLGWALARTPAGRLVTPEDVAKVVGWLASDEARMIRGQTILVDGGLMLRP